MCPCNSALSRASPYLHSLCSYHFSHFSITFFFLIQLLLFSKKTLQALNQNVSQPYRTDNTHFMKKWTPFDCNIWIHTELTTSALSCNFPSHKSLYCMMIRPHPTGWQPHPYCSSQFNNSTITRNNKTKGICHELWLGHILYILIKLHYITFNLIWSETPAILISAE